MLRVYTVYQETCERTGVVDFAELLLRCHELFRDLDDVLAHYRERFRHILVDEFQDTNTIQYAWLRLLAGSEGHVFCVGDDDQSVYGWRGARIENILQFPNDFLQVSTVRLERNYRSTGNILAAANALIANNQGRMGKNLWTDDGDGEPIAVYAGFNDIDEARFIVSRIRQWVDTGGRRDEVAILYRVSAQSRVLEEALLSQGVAYRVYGGPSILRACRDQERTRLLPPRRESRRRRRIREGRQPPAPRHRRAHRGHPAHRSEDPERIALGGDTRSDRRAHGRCAGVQRAARLRGADRRSRERLP